MNPLQALSIEVEEDDDGRWTATVDNIPGCTVQGDSWDDVVAKVVALAYELSR